MAKFIIEGGRKLKGRVRVVGNKNAALQMIAATLLTDETVELSNVPEIKDVEVMCSILRAIGARVETRGRGRLSINCSRVDSWSLPSELVSKLRAAILFLGPLLARFKKAKLRHPGGCIIGRRAVGTHFEALRSLGAEIVTGHEDYEAVMKVGRANNIFLDEASVTATGNAIMLASLTLGTTVIFNAACEPHIVNLAQMLEQMGASIEGAGTNRVVVKGVDKLKGTSINVRPDHIEAGTFAIAAAATGGEVIIDDVVPDDLRMILLYLTRFGVDYNFLKDNKRISNQALWEDMLDYEGSRPGPEYSLKINTSKLKASNKKVQTRPWPGFPTDLMSPLIVLASQADGNTLCHDWMYESRMFFVDKLIKMGASIILCDPHRVVVSGPSQLRGKVMNSPDIRAGIALVLAAICADGVSEINNVELIDRGYEKIEKRLASLGAKIERKND